MTRTGGMIQGLVLLGLGAYMGWLSLSDQYWLFLNPKFLWLTASAAVGLVLLGLVWLFWGRSRIFSASLVLFLVFGVIAGLQDSQALLSPGGGARETASPQESRLKLEGADYVKLNVPELFILATDPKGPPPPQRFALRGMLQRDPLLDERGQILILRTQVFCCLADAVALAFRVKVEDPTRYETGQWARVLGTLAPADQDATFLRKLRVRGVFMTGIQDTRVIVPDRMDLIDAPKVGHVFSVRREEPFNY